MTTDKPVAAGDPEPPEWSWLGKPIPRQWCLLGWCGATAIFVSVVVLTGGPSYNDVTLSAYSAWSIAHGQFRCAFPPGLQTTTPVYPLLSGGIAAIAGIGHAVPFPSAAALGSHCDSAFIAVYEWSVRSKAIAQTVKIGYLSWLVLLAGLVSWLRETGRGRCGWEPMTVVLAACLPPVWVCVQSTFHPEDLVAMGLALAALACARRGAWSWAGVAIALAVMSQQFTLLVAVPLLVLAPSHQRLKYVGTSIATVALLAVPLIALSSGHAARDIFLGTGDARGLGGTVVWELHLSGGLLFVVSRMLPIAFSLLLVMWVLRRLGQAALEPVALMSLIALSLGIRLVFEYSLFAYYFMPFTVALVLLEVSRGYFRKAVVTWLIALSIVLLPLTFDSWTGGTHVVLPVLVTAMTIGLVVLRVVRGRPSWGFVIALALAAGALVEWRITGATLTHPLPTWFWQVIFVTSGICLAASPLLTLVRDRATAHGKSLQETATTP